MAQMTEESESTRDRLVRVGLDLFYQKGFHAVGLDELLERVGTTKTTFYKYFESKDDLALACISHRDRRWRERFPALLRERAGDDPIAQLHEVFGVWRDWFSDIHFNGCIFLHACSEFPSPSDPCHVAAAGNINALRGVVEGLARRAGLRDPVAFADQYKLIMQGAIIVEVVDRRNEAAATAGAIAATLIERASPTRSA